MNKNSNRRPEGIAIESCRQIKELFEYLPDVFFFAKDREGRFIMANQIFVERCGEVEESAIIGKNDHDYFPHDRADLYVRDDKRVMEKGESIINRVELAPDRRFSLNLFITSKIPIRDPDGKIIGLAGIARDMERSSRTLKPFAHMSAAVEFIHEHYSEAIEIPHLARISGMSLSQFERKFKDLFQLSPQHYIIEIRLNMACKLMVTTEQTISQIAHDCGFYDHSHFTRQFVKRFGITPREYQRRHYG